MIDNISRLDFAFINCDESVLFKEGNQQAKIEIGCFAWLLHEKNSDEYYLIDTGIEDINVVNKTKRGCAFWRRDSKGLNLTDNLKKRFVPIEKVTKVILTHAHYDHISGLSHLTNATIYITKEEYHNIICEEPPFSEYLRNIKDFLLERNDKGMVVFTNDGFEIGDGIKTIFVGGHTSGGQMISLTSKDNKFLFTGDEIFLLDNAEENIPIGFCECEIKSLKAVNFCHNFKGIIMTGHDLNCMERFECLI